MRTMCGYIFLVLQALLLSGCAIEVKKDELVPAGITAFSPTGKRIYVSPVSMRPQPKPGFLMDEPPRVGAETFREAMVGTLRRTNIFSEVKTQGDADYILSADIIGQRMPGHTGNVELLLVRYKLTEVESNRVVWSDNLFSHQELSVSEVFLGADRMRQLLEGVTRDNMTQLGSKMGHVISPSRP